MSELIKNYLESHKNVIFYTGYATYILYSALILPLSQITIFSSLVALIYYLENKNKIFKLIGNVLLCYPVVYINNIN